MCPDLKMCPERVHEDMNRVSGADVSVPGIELTGLYKASGLGNKKEGGSLVHAF